MSDQNTILFEGTLIHDPERSRDEKGVPRCLLSIASERYLKKGNGREKRLMVMHVHAEGEAAEECKKNFRKGRKIRTIGSLDLVTKENEEGRKEAEVVIAAKHIEVRRAVSVKREQKPSRDGFSR